MKFDVVVGNPPYHETTGGGTVVESKASLYDKFITKSLDICSKYVLMIIPSRWLTGGNTVLSDFRTAMVESKRVKAIYNFKNSQEIFPEAEIGGGVQYLLLDKQREYSETVIKQCKVVNGKSKVLNKSKRDISRYTYLDNRGAKSYMVIVDEQAISIIEKVLSKNENTLNNIMFTANPFGIGCEFQSREDKQDGDVRIVYAMGKVGYTNKENIQKNIKDIDRFNIVTGKMSPDRGGLTASEKVLVINKPKVIYPGEVCTGTYIGLCSADNEQEVNNVISYISCKFTRFLINCTLTSVNMAKKNFMFVPVQDFNTEWTDEKLYEKYSLNESEIKYIEKTIKKMPLI